MKKKLFGINALIAIFILLLGTSAEKPDMIYWDENYRLNWDDFEGQPAYSLKSISALTSSGIVHYNGCKDDKIIYSVRSYFERNESWVKEEARTAHHLAHEQIHFDITELYARKLRRALAQREFKCGQEEAFNQFVSTFIQQWQDEQHSYDGESRHSINKVAQHEWFYKIAMELSLLDEFKDKGH